MRYILCATNIPCLLQNQYWRYKECVDFYNIKKIKIHNTGSEFIKKIAVRHNCCEFCRSIKLYPINI
ncbi:hypothetical protein BpHYR1_053011 [Brachionus plicatilis]|uniref:Uncharacterized protein n=1 Tax=Brachionus plicatilis TaxID=10195 RepID=A0A3M7SA09_BRAPC|nr:hypothetical protein BpHYR1_053011 [Brachionus plicatilis]